MNLTNPNSGNKKQYPRPELYRVNSEGTQLAH